MPPVFRTGLNWNFPLMIPVVGESGFYEGVEIHGYADGICLEASSRWDVGRRGV